MTDFVQVRIPAPLRDRIDAVRGTEKREPWVRDAIEQKLGIDPDARDIPTPAEASVLNAEADALMGDKPAQIGDRPTRGPLPPPPYVPEDQRCRVCQRNGPPLSGRPCSSCGHSKEHT